MVCPPSPKLRAYVGETLPPPDWERVDVHVQSCEACREQLDKLTAPPSELEMFRAAWRRDLNGGGIPDDPSLNCELGSDLESGLDGGASFARKTSATPEASVVSEVPVISGFLASPGDSTLSGSLARLGPSESSEAAIPFERVGRFKLECRLGLGGFGTVYRAFDTALRRRVALKVPHPTTLADPQLAARFRREGQAVARLHHENILPVFETGSHEGNSYIASAYCPGPNLAEWIANHDGRVPPAVAAEIVRHLAQAVEHAHQAGILHRDIKPANVLLDPHSRSGDLDFTPMLTDFGLARFMEDSGDHSWTGATLGTPCYMAPERALGRRDQVGPATDVYSLGVILYELLAGRPPLRGQNDADTLQRVIRTDPEPLSRTAPHVPRDLAAICHKCLEKSGQRRYSTAGALAEDLQRFRRGEATTARPDAFWTAGIRWARREPGKARLVGFAAFTFVVALTALGLHNRSLNAVNGRLERALSRARDLQTEAERSERVRQGLRYAADIRMAGRAVREGDLQYAVQLLERHDPQPDVASLSLERPVIDERGFEYWYFRALASGEPQPLGQHEGAVYHAAFSPGGRWLATAGAEGVIRLFDAASGMRINRWDSGQTEVNRVAYSPGEELLASAGDDGTIRLWQLPDGQPDRCIRAFEGKVFGVAFLAGGRQLVACSETGQLAFWDAASGQEVRRVEAHDVCAEGLVVTAGGRRVFSAGGHDRKARLWNTADGSLMGVIIGHGSRVMCVAAAGDDSLLATGTLDGVVRVWHPESLALLASFRHLDAIESLVFTHDNRGIIAGDRGGVIRHWSLPGLGESDLGDRSAARWSGHRGRVFSLALSPDGSRLVSAGEDGQVHIWLARPHRRLHHARSIATPPYQDMALDGNTDALWVLASGVLSRSPLRDRLAATDQGSESAAKENGSSLGVLEKPCLAISPRRRLLAIGDARGVVRILHADTLETVRQWQLPRKTSVRQLLFIPGSDRLAVRTYPRNECISVHDFQGRMTWTIPTPPYCDRAAVSADGRLLATHSLNEVVLWNVAQRRLMHRGAGHHDSILGLAFSPDGRHLASCSRDRAVRIWSTADGRCVATLSGHRAAVTSLAFTTDGRTLASGDQRGNLRMWHAGTWQELLEVEVAQEKITQLAFARSDESLVCLTASQPLVLSAPRRKSWTNPEHLSLPAKDLPRP